MQEFPEPKQLDMKKYSRDASLQACPVLKLFPPRTSHCWKHETRAAVRAALATALLYSGHRDTRSFFSPSNPQNAPTACSPPQVIGGRRCSSLQLYIQRSDCLFSVWSEKYHEHIRTLQETSSIHFRWFSHKTKNYLLKQNMKTSPRKYTEI